MWRPRLIAVLAVVVAGCASEPTRDWMKVSDKYTVEDFRRDYAACSRGGKLEDSCMRDRGWVDVARPADKPSEQGSSSKSVPSSSRRY
jgi:hypothetical protein